MSQNKAVAAFRRTAISLAVGLCLSRVVYAQSADGNILGKAKGGAPVTPTPGQIITRDETLMSGFASTAAALQSTAATSGSSQINNAFGGFVTDGGPGANTIALRGLSATRTLVLLNGRRI